MSAFSNLFSIEPSDVKKSCILLPFVNKTILSALGLAKLSSGKIYDVGQTKELTVIRTGMGSTFLGDAVLHLQETPAQSLFLFGACGATAHSFLDCGDLVSPKKTLSLESFSEIIRGQLKAYCESYPDEMLFGQLQELPHAKNVRTVTCATFGSLKLEEEHRWFFERHAVDVVDMECSAFFEAAQHIKRKALAIFCVTDLISQKPLFSEAAKKDQGLIDKGIVQGIKLIKNLSEGLG